MVSEWHTVKVGDLGRIVTGKTPKTANKENYGGLIPFLTPSDDMESKFVRMTNKTLTEKGKQEVRNTLLPENSVCVSCIGTDLGKVVITTEPTITNQQINSIIVDSSLYDVSFVYYAMLILGKHLNKISKGSTTVPIVNKSLFSSFEIRCPNLSIQKKISRILSDLDEKIELNNKINDNLQQQVQLLYSQLISKLSDECKVSLVSKGICRILPAKIDKYDGEKVYIATADVTNHSITNKSTRLNYNFRPSRANMQPIPWSLWFAKMKASPKFIFINDNCSELVNKCIFSTGFYGLQANRDIFYYLWAVISSPEFDIVKDAYCSGTTMQALNNEGLENITVYMPSKEELAKFTETVEPIFNAIYVNTIENEKLQNIRDTLLPKLMSGELDVSKIKI